MTDTQWGRKETIVRPPHYPVYSFGAIFIALFVTALCMYLHFAFVMTPLQRYYVPCYLETGFLSTVRQSSNYQLVTVADRQRHARPVTKPMSNRAPRHSRSVSRFRLRSRKRPTLLESSSFTEARRLATRIVPSTTTYDVSSTTATASLRSFEYRCGPVWRCSFCSFHPQSAKMFAD